MHLSYRLNLPTDGRHVSVVRRLTVGALTELEVDEGCVDDIALALTEACANVVQHGDDAGGFEVEVAVDAATCRITVREAGGAFTGLADGAGAPLAGDEPLTHGRGIELMRLLVDQLRYVPDGDGTTVVLVKELSLRPGSVLADT